MHKSGRKFLKENPFLTTRITSCIEKIKKVLNVKTIILFGSVARGEYAPNKTMDVLVVARTKLGFFERIKRVLEACKGGKPSIEPIVYTPKEVKLLREQGEGFLEEAMEEGVILYEK